MNEILQQFVARKSEVREWMQSPFKTGEWVYATNGHIAVRVPAGGQELRNDAQPTIDMGKLFRAVVDRVTKIDLPALPEAEPCWLCCGSGVAYRCADCGGEGVSEFTDCETCGGNGQLSRHDADATSRQECFECDGSGNDRTQEVVVTDRLYARRYLAKIAALPGLAFHQTPDRSEPAFFTFSGGEGLLMPLRKGAGASKRPPEQKPYNQTKEQT